jgi:hypothetical protein
MAAPRARRTGTYRTLPGYVVGGGPGVPGPLARVVPVRLLVYSALRLAVLAAALGLGWLLGLRSWLLVLVAAVIAALASYVFLRGPRDAAAADLAARARARAADRADDDAAVEDAADERARRPVRAPGGGPAGASEGERHGEQDAVAELDEPGVAQDEDELAPGGPAEHPTREPQDRDG